MLRLKKRSLSRLNKPLKLVNLQLMRETSNIDEYDEKLVIHNLDLIVEHVSIHKRKAVFIGSGKSNDKDFIKHAIKSLSKKHGKFLEKISVYQDFILFVPIFAIFDDLELPDYRTQTEFHPYERLSDTDPDNRNDILESIISGGHLWDLKNMQLAYLYGALEDTDEICESLIKNKPILLDNSYLFNDFQEESWVNKIKLPTDYRLYLRGITECNNYAVCAFNHEVK